MADASKPPIGICDSGSGGLTVLAALANRLPTQSFVYLGDHANAPYGHRTEAEITKFTVAMLDRLFARGIRLVVLACNTASAIALRKIQEEWLPKAHPDRRVLGVLVPMVEALTGLPWDRDNPGTSEVGARTVAVFATVRTVASGAYPHQIKLRAKGFKMFQQACPGLVGAIEADAPRDEMREMVKGYCQALLSQMEGAKPDAVFLGCTHYPLVEDLFRENLPKGVEILSQPEIVAASLKGYLARHPEFVGEGKPALQFFTTGEPAALHHIGKFMPNAALDFTGI
jgi:glutamate racemase